MVEKQSGLKLNDLKQFVIKDIIPLRLVDYIDKTLENHRKKIFEMFKYKMDEISMQLSDLNFIMTQVMNESIIDDVPFNALENLKSTEFRDLSRKSEKEADNMAITEEKIWLGLTKSGKGISVKAGNDFYVGNIETLKKFVAGKIKGVPLSKVVPDKKD